jgi:hypothetical protein
LNKNKLGERVLARRQAVDDFRDFPGRRWLIVGLRALHLVGMVGVGAALIYDQPLAAKLPSVLALAISGVAMMAIDLWTSPGHLTEMAGGAMLVKLLLLACLILVPPQQLMLFWIILVLSAVIAHAPARMRHRRIFGARGA